MSYDEPTRPQACRDSRARLHVAVRSGRSRASRDSEPPRTCRISERRVSRWSNSWSLWACSCYWFCFSHSSLTAPRLSPSLDTSRWTRIRRRDSSLIGWPLISRRWSRDQMSIIIVKSSSGTASDCGAAGLRLLQAGNDQTAFYSTVPGYYPTPTPTHAYTRHKPCLTC